MEKRKILFLFILVFALFTVLISNVNAESELTVVGEKYQLPSDVSSTDEEENGAFYKAQWRTITLHANGEGQSGGYFDSQDVTEKESLQIRGEAFVENTVPQNTNPDYIFVGWSTDPAAHEVNVQSGATSTSSIGDDLYAVWVNHINVKYQVPNGNVDIGDGSPGPVKIKSYELNDSFIGYIPVSNLPDLFTFSGWYQYINGQKILIQDGYILTDSSLVVNAKWDIKLDAVPTISAGDEYNIDGTKAGAYYKITPSETKVFEIYSNYTTDESNSGLLSLYNSDYEKIADGQLQIHNSTLTYTMEAGQTYVIQYYVAHSQEGELKIDVGIKEADSRIVTFHANRDSQGDAYFDGDPTKTTKQIPFAVGTEIESYDGTGLEVTQPNRLSNVGWTRQPQTGGELQKIFVTEDMDVYGFYWDMDSIILDANGGYFSSGGTESEYIFPVGVAFDPAIMPKNDNREIKFAGWSKSPTATKPDDDILPTVTPAEDLPKRLYAVYTEKILEEWDSDPANGGYFLSNPDVTTYEGNSGKGRVFYGLALFNDDEKMTPLGYTDQDGEFIPYTISKYPYYHTKGDTKYTAVWGYKVSVDANGGTFEKYRASSLRLVMPVDDPYSLQYIFDTLGYPVHNTDPNKYVIGFATTPDATEPDVIDGQTDVKSLGRIYAVWADDEYVFNKGENATWEKGSSEGLEFIIKRKGHDDKTYSSFISLEIDGQIVSDSNYTKKAGSLVLTLEPEYLKTLSTGTHEVVFNFADNNSLRTTITISENSGGNPPTGDNMFLYLTILGLSLIGLTGMYICKKKFN